ncbi:MAG TPA: cell filamentation protein Fic [Clostridiales bacterium]|nr:cell filamentation protein Fic [Clostridiales bacterium]
MRTFDYKSRYERLLSPDVVALLSQIHEFRGKQALFEKGKPEILLQLLEIAKIQSTESSNRIEGIVTTEERLQLLVRDKTMPKTRSEKEIAGYRDVLSTIHGSYSYIPPKPPIILQLHRDLYRFSGQTIGGNYKTGDNVIAEEHPDGTKTIRFQPIPAWETPRAMQDLCGSFDIAMNDGELDPLLVIPMFILDFLCIHPFNDGNGRMSRLLTLLLLYRAGYIVGKYVSLERLIADSKETYYEVLQESSYGWHEEKNDDVPFVRYLLGVIVAAYREFDERSGLLLDEKISKTNRIREIIKEHIGTITKSEIRDLCRDVSEVTIERVLRDLTADGSVLKIGGGRYTKYVWNRDKE